MSNKEKYQRAFGAIHSSRDYSLEVKDMKKRGFVIPRVAVASFAVVALLGISSGTAYAMDLGGIQETIRIWIHGREATAVMNLDDGVYTITYTDENGELQQIGGSGVAIDANGNESQVTVNEFVENLDRPEVVYENDGSIWVVYHAQKIEITNSFNEDDICYLDITENDKHLYLTIKNDGSGGYAMSDDGFKSPKDFSTAE